MNKKHIFSHLFRGPPNSIDILQDHGTNIWLNNVTSGLCSWTKVTIYKPPKSRFICMNTVKLQSSVHVLSMPNGYDKAGLSPTVLVFLACLGGMWRVLWDMGFLASM